MASLTRKMQNQFALTLFALVAGTITAEEFRMGLASVGLDLSIQKIEALLSATDTDHDGVIQYDEWINQLRPKRTSYTGHAGAERGTSFAVADGVLQELYKRPENFEQTFRKIDGDGNGWVSKKEFKQALQELGVAGPNGLAERDFKVVRSPAEPVAHSCSSIHDMACVLPAVGSLEKRRLQWRRSTELL